MAVAMDARGTCCRCGQVAVTSTMDVVEEGLRCSDCTNNEDYAANVERASQHREDPAFALLAGALVETTEHCGRCGASLPLGPDFLTWKIHLAPHVVPCSYCATPLLMGQQRRFLYAWSMWARVAVAALFLVASPFIVWGIVYGGEIFLPVILPLALGTTLPLLLSPIWVWISNRRLPPPPLPADPFD